MSTTVQDPSGNRVPEHLQQPHDGHYEWLMRRLWDRLNWRNEHFVGCIVGQEGIGKSHTSMKIGEAVDPSFTHERVYFDVANLLEVLRDGEFQAGEVYVLDEAGVSMGRRTWQERSQILANQAFQLIRSHNLGLIFTLPRLSELDSQAAGRLQWFYEITEKEMGEYVRGKWKFRDPNRGGDNDTIYDKYPRRRVDGDLLRITSFAFRPPSESLVEPYEERKQEYQEQVYDEVISELRDEEEDNDDVDLHDIADEVINNRLDEFVDEHGGNGRKYVDRDLLRLEYDLTHDDAGAVAKLVKREVEI